MTKAELLEENEALLRLLADIDNEAGIELPEDIQTRISEFLDGDEEEDE